MEIRKKRLLRIIIVIACALLLLTAAVLVLEAIVSDRGTPELDYEFYLPSEEEDYFNDSQYLSKDRYIHYTDDMGQMTVISENVITDDIGPAFFKLYFFALTQGDSDMLNSLYSQEYLSKQGSFKPFTPQRIYAIELKYLYEEADQNGGCYITYALDYNIMKNDGSFRQDIGSDMSRTQYITIRYDSKETLIESVKSEYRR